MASDVMFKSASTLAPSTAINPARDATPEQPGLMRFLGRKVPPQRPVRNFKGEVVSDLKERPRMRIKHR